MVEQYCTSEPETSQLKSSTSGPKTYASKRVHGSVGEPNHVRTLFLRGPTEKFTSDRVTERALKIFVAGTVNGSRMHRFAKRKLYEVPRFEARGKSHGSDGHRYYATFLT